MPKRGTNADGDTIIVLSDDDVWLINQLIIEHNMYKDELTYCEKTDSASQALLRTDSLIIADMRGDSLLFQKIIEEEQGISTELKSQLQATEKLLKKEIRRKKLLGIISYTLIGIVAVEAVIILAK